MSAVRCPSCESTDLRVHCTHVVHEGQMSRREWCDVLVCNSCQTMFCPNHPDRWKYTPHKPKTDA